MPRKPKWKRLDEVLDAYLTSPKFRKLRAGTQANWRRQLLYVGRVIGMIRIDELRVSHARELIQDGLAEWPGKQQNCLKALRAAEKWALGRDLLCHPLTYGIEIDAPDSGHIPWTDEQADLAQARARDILRRPIILMRWTGQRGSDIVRMGWSDVKTIDGRDFIHVIQVKTGCEVFCPISGPLEREMATWERRPGPFCRKADDQPWTRQQLSDTWAHEKQKNPELRTLRELVLHGLRGHCCVRLHRAGLDTHDVAALVGMSEKMVGHYCKHSKKEKDALAAVIRLEGRRPIAPPAVHLDEPQVQTPDLGEYPAQWAVRTK